MVRSALCLGHGEQAKRLRAIRGRCRRCGAYDRCRGHRGEGGSCSRRRLLGVVVDGDGGAPPRGRGLRVAGPWCAAGLDAAPPAVPQVARGDQWAPLRRPVQRVRRADRLCPLSPHRVGADLRSRPDLRRDRLTDRRGQRTRHWRRYSPAQGCRTELQRRRVSYWSIGVVETNSEAVQLYERLGFRPWTREMLGRLGEQIWSPREPKGLVAGRWGGCPRRASGRFVAPSVKRELASGTTDGELNPKAGLQAAGAGVGEEYRAATLGGS